jgi:hypothetical protein
VNAIRTLWGAFGNLAASLNALADTVRCADARLKHQLALDGPEAEAGPRPRPRSSTTRQRGNRRPCRPPVAGGAGSPPELP